MLAFDIPDNLSFLGENLFLVGDCHILLFCESKIMVVTNSVALVSLSFPFP